MTIELVLAILVPARGRHRPRTEDRRPEALPRQARRTYHSPTELLAREFPEWRVYAMPSARGLCFGATDRSRLSTVNGYTAEELRARIRVIEQIPPPELVRPYLAQAARR
ncbi:hypothetical protein [Nocardiopsis sp. NPDC006938]|uniref:hypothetical protein n=1 Tax=Nocardiopsis sp. NPDC006938 TaxID=3364337 RepID=UPI0036B84882